MQMFSAVLKTLNATTNLNCLHKVASGLQANGKCKTQDGTDDKVIGHTKKPSIESTSEL
jgi:hypothetical protein